jgi:hypothetical protein
MCLEFLNQFVGLWFAWLGLAVFSVSLAGLAVFSCLARRAPAGRQNGGFTCPCYAPPIVSPSEDHD